MVKIAMLAGVARSIILVDFEPSLRTFDSTVCKGLYSAPSPQFPAAGCETFPQAIGWYVDFSSGAIDLLRQPRAPGARHATEAFYQGQRRSPDCGLRGAHRV